MNHMMFVSSKHGSKHHGVVQRIALCEWCNQFTKSNFQEIVNMLGLFHNSALFGSRAGTAMTNMINKLSATPAGHDPDRWLHRDDPQEQRRWIDLTDDAQRCNGVQEDDRGR